VGQYTVEVKRQLVSEYVSSGKEKKAWCEERGLACSTFTNWLRLSGIREPAPLGAVERASASISKSRRQEPSREGRKAGSRVVWAALNTQFMSVPSKETETEIIVNPATQARINISRGGWAIDVGSGFDAELLAEVMKVVNRVCC